MTTRFRGTGMARGHMTLADVCRAIAEGELPARQQGQWYAIRKRDIADYASRILSQTGRAS